MPAEFLKRLSWDDIFSSGKHEDSSHDNIDDNCSSDYTVQTSTEKGNINSNNIQEDAYLDYMDKEEELEQVLNIAMQT